MASVGPVAISIILDLAKELPTQDFEELLLLQGLGPRTLQSLTLVSEVIHGTPSRFTDPARFSFAHGGKDGHPFPVPTRVYDESIDVLKNAVNRAKIDRSDKLRALNALHRASVQMEKDFIPTGNLRDVVEKERTDSWKYGGKTVKGDEMPPKPIQGKLFD
jgi:hypothetical protein